MVGGFSHLDFARVVFAKTRDIFDEAHHDFSFSIRAPFAVEEGELLGFLEGGGIGRKTMDDDM